MYLLYIYSFLIDLKHLKMAELTPSTSSALRNNQGSNEITWKHPSHVFQRLLALIFMCLIGFGQ